MLHATKSVVDPMIDWSGGRPIIVTVVRSTTRCLAHLCSTTALSRIIMPWPSLHLRLQRLLRPQHPHQRLVGRMSCHKSNSTVPANGPLILICRHIVSNGREVGWREKLNFGQPVTLPPTPAAPAAIVPTPAAPLPSAPTTTTTPNLSPAEQQTTRLVFDYNAYWSQGGRNVEECSAQVRLAPKVMSYGNTIAREKVMNEKRTFSARWPIRHYTIKPNSLSVQCENDGPCSATGIVAWDCTSQERGEHSVGTANFAVSIINGVIVSENG